MPIKKQKIGEALLIITISRDSNRYALHRLLRDAHYLNQQFSGLKNTNASFGMLEAVITEKQLSGSRPSPAAPRTSTSSLSVATEATTQAKPQAVQSNLASTMESANVRLKGIFRRSSTMLASEPKSPIAPSSPIQERRFSGLLPEKPLVEEPQSTPQAPDSTPPPPTPGKDDSNTTLSIPTSAPNSRPSSPVDRPRSPRMLEKALPIPVPTLNADGDIIDSTEEILNLPPTPSAIDEIMDKSANGGPHLNGTRRVNSSE